MPVRVSDLRVVSIVPLSLVNQKCWGLDQSIPVEVIRDLLQKLDPSLRDIFEDVLLEVLEVNGSQ